VKVLVTCPPMVRMIDEFRPHFARLGVEVTAPAVVQTLPESELIDLLPQFDGWIIGDDPATRAVFAAGKAGKLRAAVKWGVGVDNVDFVAARELGLPITNTPGAFGGEVADVAVAYVTMLARELATIDRGVRAGGWPKPAGVSLAGKTVGLVGYGDIGRNVGRRLAAADMKLIAYDPALTAAPEGVEVAQWPARVEEADFLVFTCALTPKNRHMLDAGVLATTKRGVRIVNVARGPLIDEPALVAALRSGQVRSAALDVFEVEPLPADSPLRGMEQCVFGSHNGSNTVDAVRRTSERAIGLLAGYLGLTERAG
jgi:D-3-phosphoglycerate dehydrogenase